MSDSAARRVAGAVTGPLLGVVLAVAVGWTTLVLGGRTDGSGRMGLALGGAVFALVSLGWRRGSRGWLQGLAGAMILGGAMLAHFWSRVGRLP